MVIRDDNQYIKKNGKKLCLQTKIILNKITCIILLGQFDLKLYAQFLREVLQQFMQDAQESCAEELMYA